MDYEEAIERNREQVERIEQFLSSYDSDTATVYPTTLENAERLDELEERVDNIQDEIDYISGEISNVAEMIKELDKKADELIKLEMYGVPYDPNEGSRDE